jgi:hypothetical protein
MAAQNGRVDMVKFLLSQGADVNSRDWVRVQGVSRAAAFAAIALRCAAQRALRCPPLARRRSAVLATRAARTLAARCAAVR